MYNFKESVVKNSLDRSPCGKVMFCILLQSQVIRRFKFWNVRIAFVWIFSCADDGQERRDVQISTVSMHFKDSSKERIFHSAMYLLSWSADFPFSGFLSVPLNHEKHSTVSWIAWHFALFPISHSNASVPFFFWDNNHRNNMPGVFCQLLEAAWNTGFFKVDSVLKRHSIWPRGNSLTLNARLKWSVLVKRLVFITSSSLQRSCCTCAMEAYQGLHWTTIRNPFVKLAGQFYVITFILTY